MSQNDQTVEPPLDAEDWEIAFKVYEGQSSLALTLAYHLSGLKGFFQSDATDITQGVAAIDRAIDGLYPHTDFRKVSYQLFRAAIEGKLTPEQEDLIKQLGIKT